MKSQKAAPPFWSFSDHLLEAEQNPQTRWMCFGTAATGGKSNMCRRKQPPLQKNNKNTGKPLLSPVKPVFFVFFCGLGFYECARGWVCFVDPGGEVALKTKVRCSGSPGVDTWREKQYQRCGFSTLTLFV